MSRRALAALILSAATVSLSGADAPALTPALLADLTWRSIGPAVTSGRVVDIAGPEGAANAHATTFYVAAASGGLWKTINGGTTFDPIFEKESTISIGDVAVAPSNPDIVWVGTGEANNQRSSSWGDGVYRSLNGGKTWTNTKFIRRVSQRDGTGVIRPTPPASRSAFMVVPGLAIGLVASAAGTRLMERFLYGVQPTDPMTFIGVSGGLAVVAVAASVWPALRAARVDPVQALRGE
jgi:hypothetical protein